MLQALTCKQAAFAHDMDCKHKASPATARHVHYTLPMTNEAIQSSKENPKPDITCRQTGDDDHDDDDDVYDVVVVKAAFVWHLIGCPMDI